MNKYNITEEELETLLDKFEDRLITNFGEEYYAKVVIDFLNYLETYTTRGFTAPTREYQLEYAFGTWLDEVE